MSHLRPELRRRSPDEELFAFSQIRWVLRVVTVAGTVLKTLRSLCSVQNPHIRQHLSIHIRFIFVFWHHSEIRSPVRRRAEYSRISYEPERFVVDDGIQCVLVFRLDFLFWKELVSFCHALLINFCKLFQMPLSESRYLPSSSKSACCINTFFTALL